MRSWDPESVYENVILAEECGSGDHVFHVECCINGAILTKPLLSKNGYTEKQFV